MSSAKSGRSWRSLTGALLVGVLLVGCAAPHGLYYWGDYQPRTYAWLRGEGVDAADQVLALNRIVERARAHGQMVPPGLHAHLAMLHVANGHPDRAQREFEKEKALFPESAAYMDFLLAGLKGERK